MGTALLSHPDCWLHSDGPGHPETAERLTAIFAELDRQDYAALARYEAPLAFVDQIALVHDRLYVERILDSVPAQGLVLLEEETALVPGTDRAARRAAGAVISAVDLVRAGKATNAFCAVRPPGHHAGRATPEGFCLFNNLAIGAAHAIQEYGLKRIAVLDFDVHHGNGTQEWAEDHPEVLFCSTHQSPLWPGSGEARECGRHNNIINVPMPPGSTGDDLSRAMRDKVFPRFEALRPELILISAGFDAHREDPLASLEYDAQDFAWLTSEMCRIARRHGAPIVSTLEGGYHLKALAQCVGAHVKALMEG